MNVVSFSVKFFTGEEVHLGYTFNTKEHTDNSWDKAGSPY